MKYRRKMGRKENRKNFRRGTRIKKKNLPRGVMRGGIRL